MRTKRLITFFLGITLSIGIIGIGQAQEIEWIRQFGTWGNDFARSVSLDSSGVYVAGYTSGAFPGQSSAGWVDAFVRKYDLNGNEVWTGQFGTWGNDWAYGVSVDSSGVYVAGRTSGTLPGQSSAGATDAFVRKYDPNGNEVWTRQFGTWSEEYAYDDVSVDSSGVYVVGSTRGAFPGQSSAGEWDAFVVKFPQPANTPTGTNVSVTPDPAVSITFEQVTKAGNTEVTVSSANPGSEKTDFKFLGTFYDITTTANYSGQITVCLTYDDSGIPAGREKSLKIFHWSGTDWVNVTSSLDTVNNIICAQVSSLPWFAAAYELDGIAPTTKISLSGTLGNNGWYVSNVHVALTATDNEGGSGVAKTEYSFDGITWNTYTAPFMVSTEGTTTVYYRSTDEAGNVETTKTEAIKIDKTLPSITIASPQAKDYLHSENVTLNFSATDALSGIATITGLLDSTPATNGQVIDLRTLTLGQHTLAVTAVDKAGNSASKTVTFNVKPVPATVDFKPDTLNKASQSDKSAVTVYIEVPGYDVNAIDVATVTLSTSKGSVSAQLKPTEVGDYDKDGVPDRMVKFDRQAVIAIVDVGEKVKITISGKIAGAIFEGSDEIRVIEGKD